MIRRVAPLLLTMSSVALVGVAAGADAGDNEPGIDNVVVIVVDDMAVNEMIALPKTKALLGDTGITFTNSFVNTSNCCPSRATYLTGQRSSNHGVTSTDWRNNPDNSYLALDHDNTLPVWLSAAGFETIHVGKYLNGYGGLSLDPSVANQREVPPGWTDFHAFVGEKRFVNFTLSENGELNEYRGDENYQTDVLARVGAQAVTDAVEADKPFFMWITPFAPHTQGGKPPVPAARHEHAFDGVELPRPANFNEANVSDKPGFIRNQPRLSDNGSPRSDVAQLRDLYEGRLESLLAVDDLVETVVQRLDDEGVLDSTLVVFSSDNGYLMGNHRLEGKIRVYDESIRVPLLMSGGPFTGGVDESTFVSNLDLAPTFLALLGVAPGLVVDGIDLSRVVDDPVGYENRALIIEAAEGPGYDAVRTSGWMYAEYYGSGVELYDMVDDSQQLESLHDAAELAEQRADLAALLERLRSCTGVSCALDADGNTLGSGPPTVTTGPPVTTTPTVTTGPPVTTTPTVTTGPPVTTTPTVTTSSPATTTPAATTSPPVTTTSTVPATATSAPSTPVTTDDPQPPAPTVRLDHSAATRGLARAARLASRDPG